jgi:hypothetical protein
MYEFGFENKKARNLWTYCYVSPQIPGLMIPIN